MQLRVPEAMAAGTQVQCPKCNVLFAVPAAPAPPSAAPGQFTAGPPAGFPAPTSVTPGTAQDFGHPFPGNEPRDPLQRLSSTEGLGRAYALDLNPIFARANLHFSSVMGPMIGYNFLVALIIIPIVALIVVFSVIPIVGRALGYVLSAATLTPLTAGFVIVSLAQMRGRPWNFGDFFGGFHHWKALFLVGLASGLTLCACLLPAEIVTLLSGSHPMHVARELIKGNPPTSDAKLDLLANLLQLAGWIVYGLIFVRYFVVAQFLIVDRDYGGFEAIRGSAAIVTGHYWGWLGVLLLFLLIEWLGLLACCVGTLFTQPYSILLFTSAYLHATGERASSQSLPY
jgi:hypothetical protein